MKNDDDLSRPKRDSCSGKGGGQGSTANYTVTGTGGEGCERRLGAL